MSFLVKGITLSIALFAQYSWACNPQQDPHSLSCQQAVWQGALSQGPGRDFYVTPMSPQLLQQTWRPNQFTPVSGQFASWLTTHNDPRKPIRTTGVTNRDGSIMGDLNIEWLPNNRLAARADSWLDSKFDFNAHPSKSQLELQADPTGSTIILADSNNEMVLLCRNFLRAGNNHLTCKLHVQLKGNLVLIGYLGLLPAESAPTSGQWGSQPQHPGQWQSQEQWEDNDNNYNDQSQPQYRERRIRKRDILKQGLKDILGSLLDHHDNSEYRQPRRHRHGY